MSDGGRPPLRRLVPAELDTDQRALYEVIAGGPRAAGPQHFRLVDADGSLEGPFNAFLLQPTIGGPLQALGGAIRYATSFDDRTRELAILVVAAVWDSAFERHAHEPIGRAAGISDDELAAIRAGRAADTEEHWPERADLTVVRAARALVLDGDLDDDLHAEVIDLLGEAGLFELSTLVGYYATLALQLRVFRVAAPTDHAPTDQQGPN